MRVDKKDHKNNSYAENNKILYKKVNLDIVLKLSHIN